MQDRVSQYPGRVKLTPVSGQENVYDMEWADGATVAGTPLNKASLLTDETAALFGLGADAVPDDVFQAIGTSLVVVGIKAIYVSQATNYTVSVDLGFKPRAVIASNKFEANAIRLFTQNTTDRDAGSITDTGFKWIYKNTTATAGTFTIVYIAFR